MGFRGVFGGFIAKIAKNALFWTRVCMWLEDNALNLEYERENAKSGLEAGVVRRRSKADFVRE